MARALLLPRRAGLIEQLLFIITQKKAGSARVSIEQKTNLLIIPFHFANILAVFGQDFENTFDCGLTKWVSISNRNVIDRAHQFFLLGLVRQAVATKRASCLLHILNSLLHPVDVLQTKLGLDDLHIPERVDVTLDVDNLRVIKRSDDLEDTVDGADM